MGKLDKFLNELYKRPSTYVLLALVSIFLIIPMLTATIFCSFNPEISWNNTYLLVLILLILLLGYFIIGIGIYKDEWKK